MCKVEMLRIVKSGEEVNGKRLVAQQEDQFLVHA